MVRKWLYCSQHSECGNSVCLSVWLSIYTCISIIYRCAKPQQITFYQYTYMLIKIRVEPLTKFLIKKSALDNWLDFEFTDSNIRGAIIRTSWAAFSVGDSPRTRTGETWRSAPAQARTWADAAGSSRTAASADLGLRLESFRCWAEEWRSCCRW